QSGPQHLGRPPRTVTRRSELRRTNPSYSGTCRVAPVSSRGLELGVGDVWNRLDFRSNYESNLSFEDPELSEFIRVNLTHRADIVHRVFAIACVHGGAG